MYLIKTIHWLDVFNLNIWSFKFSTLDVCTVLFTAPKKAFERKMWSIKRCLGGICMQRNTNGYLSIDIKVKLNSDFHKDAFKRMRSLECPSLILIKLVFCSSGSNAHFIAKRTFLCFFLLFSSSRMQKRPKGGSRFLRRLVYFTSS